MFKISPYKAKVFQTCSRKYQFEYVDRRPDLKKPKPYLTLGENVHRALRDFFRFRPEIRSEESLRTLLRNHWKSRRGASGGFVSEEQERSFQDKALRMLEGFLMSQDLQARPVLTEDFYEMPLAQGLILNGRVDRADQEPDGTLSVLDYKTGRYDERYAGLADAQLLAYALLVEFKLKKRVSRVAYLYLDGSHQIETEPTPHSLEVTREEFIRTAGVIQQSEKDRAFQAQPNTLCPWCDYLSICPEAREESYQPAPLEVEAEEW